LPLRAGFGLLDERTGGWGTEGGGELGGEGLSVGGVRKKGGGRGERDGPSRRAKGLVVATDIGGCKWQRRETPERRGYSGSYCTVSRGG